MPNDFIRNVTKDPIDLRDLYYIPSLRILPRQLVPVWLEKSKNASIQIRDQGADGTCTGQALAALVDLLRIEDGRLGNSDQEPVKPASARMLYEMAVQHETQLYEGKPEVFTLRAALKGFYNNGVCLDEQWPYHPLNPDGGLDDVRSRAARGITLGAYYRVRPLLNDYHAALNDVGALYVSAAVHPGWESNVVGNKRGEIVPAGQGDQDWGGHAFVVVGYLQEGFLVLNSWGREWGGYRGWPGIGLWRYQDWADSIRDAWVLRLAVPTPDDFSVAVGEQGLTLSDTGSLGCAPPRIEIIGHYLHFDDGLLTTRGSYPSRTEDIDVTAGRLRKLLELEPQKYEHVLLWFDGVLGTVKEAMARASAGCRYWKDRRIYPLYVVWIQDLIESTMACVEPVFESSVERAGKAKADRDRLIETSLRGVGRAVWRDIVRTSWSTAKLMSETGVLEKLTGLQPISLHILADGIGAVLLLHVLGGLSKDSLIRIRSLTLVNPCVTPDEIARGLDPTLQARTLLCRPSPATERHCHLGPYSKSWLHLVASAFAEPDDRGKPPVYLGMSEAASPMPIFEMDIPVRLGDTALQRPVCVYPGLARRILEHIYSSRHGAE